MPHRFISAMSSKLRLWLLVALLLIMQCPSLSIAATELDGSTTAPGEVQPKKYCHGYQTSCPLEAPLKIHQPEHNQNYQWTFSSSGDPRGPALFPNIDIDLLPPSGETSLVGHESLRSFLNLLLHENILFKRAYTNPYSIVNVIKIRQAPTPLLMLH